VIGGEAGEVAETLSLDYSFHNAATLALSGKLEGGNRKRLTLHGAKLAVMETG
jgi:hypothetical protein